MALSTFSQFTDSVLLHIRLAPRRGRHDSAAQFFCALYRPAPADLDVWHNLSSQVLSVISRLTSCATRVCCACVDLITCVAVRYLTLRTDCEKHGRKNPLPFLFSKRSPVFGLRQIRKQGKGRSSKRKGNLRCPFLFAPAAGAATLPPRQRRIPTPWVRRRPRRKQKHRRPPVRGVRFYSISSRTEKTASCSVLSSLYSISREYALQMQICAQCMTSPLASHSYTSSS